MGGGATANEVKLSEVEIAADYLGESTEDSGSYGYKESKVATGLELSILKTPQSIDALTSKNLKDNLNSTFSVNDSVSNAVGVSTNKHDSQRLIFQARKMQITNINFDGYDGVNYIYSEFGSISSMNDVSFYDRVEIIRGANGLMSGVGNPSASVNFVRKVPNLDKDFARLGLNAGSWNFARADADISYALNKDRSIRARLNVATQKGGSFIDRYREGKALGYGVIDFDIGDSSLLRFGADYAKSKTRSVMWGNHSYRYYVENPNSTFPLLTGDLTNYPINLNYAPNWAGADNKKHSQFIKFRHFFNNDFELNLDFINENYKQKWQMFSAIPVTKDGNFQGSDMPFTDTNFKNKGLDIKLNGSYDLGGINNSFMLGLGLLKSQMVRDIWTSNDKIYSWRIRYPGRYFDGEFAPRPKLDVLQGTDNVKIDKKHIYLSNKTDFTDKFALILGGRLTQYNSLSKSSGWSASYNAKSSNFSKYLGMTYEYLDKHIVYASMTDIFTPQDDKVDINKNALKPAVGVNYELGLKSQFGGLNANFAIFETRRNGIAIEGGLIPNDPDTTYYKGVNGAKNRGFEIGINGKVADKINVYAGYTYTTAKDENGKKIFTETPDKTFKLGFDYEALAGLNLGANSRWQSKTYRPNPYDANDILTIKSFYVVDLHANYNVTKNLKLQANINNLFNKKYIVDNWGFMHTHGEPRNFMIRAEYEF